MENYDCFGNYFKEDKLVEGFSHHTYTDRYCLGEGSHIYKRINLEKRDILKKNPCNNCWCKNNEKFDKLDNHHKYLYCKKGMRSDKDIAKVIEEVKNKIKKYDRIMLLKKNLQKIENNEKFIKQIEDGKVKDVNEKELNVTFNKSKSITENLIKYDKLIEDKKKNLEQKLEKALDEEEEQEEKDIISEQKEIDEMNKKEIDLIRKSSDNIINEITKLKLTEQEKSMSIIKLNEELEEELVEIKRLKKLFTDNKDNLMETKNLLFKCNNVMAGKLVCPNYNITFFVILALMIIFVGYIYMNHYDKVFTF